MRARAGLVVAAVLGLGHFALAQPAAPPAAATVDSSATPASEPTADLAPADAAEAAPVDDPGVPADAPGGTVPPESLPPASDLVIDADVIQPDGSEAKVTPDAVAVQGDVVAPATVPATEPRVALLGAPPASPAHGAFEQRHVEEAAATLNRRLALGAETPRLGLAGAEVVAFVDFVGFPVFRPGELIPTFLNVFHWQTAEAVVRREVLLAPGKAWEPDRALESARNLRRLGIFQFVRVEPVRDAEGRLGLLVVTRDLWSLRFEQSFQYTGGQFDQLTLQLTERNVFGRNKRGTARFNLDPATFALGALYDDPRLLLGETHLEVAADAFFTRADQTYDGLYAHALVEKPFYNLAQRWGWLAQVDHLDRTRRQLQAGGVLTWDDPATDAVETVNRAFASRVVSGIAAARMQVSTGSFAHRLTLGLRAFHRNSDVIGETNLGDADEAAFRAAVLPSDLNQVGPLVSWNLFSRRFRTYQDLRAFGVSEDARLGPAVYVGLDAPLEVLGSSATALRYEAGAGYTLDYAGDGLLDGLVATEGRLQGGELLDRVLLLRARAATPSFAAGRLVLRADWIVRDRDTANTFVSLGGHNGLRGYVSQAFYGFGADRLRGNAEYRTAPWAFSWLHLGLAAFYDVGEVYENTRDFTLRQSVGMGLRILFPQFNREVFRVDFGVPVGGGSGFVINFSAGSQQAVPLSPEEDRGAESVIGGFENQP